MKFLLPVVLALLLAGCVTIETSAGNMTIAPSVQATLATPIPTAVANYTLPDSLKICVIGERTQNAFKMLNGSLDFRNKTVVFEPEFFDGEAGAVELQNCVLIILKDDSIGKFVSRPARKAILEKTSAGASLITLGAAATRIEGDNASMGWAIGAKGLDSIEDLIPVKSDAPGFDWNELGTVNASGTFVIEEVYFSEKIWGGLKNFAFENWTFTKVTRRDFNAVEAVHLVEGFEHRATSVSHIGITIMPLGILKGYSLYFSHPAFDVKESGAQSATRSAILFLLNDFLNRAYPL